MSGTITKSIISVLNVLIPFNKTYSYHVKRMIDESVISMKCTRIHTCNQLEFMTLCLLINGDIFNSIHLVEYNLDRIHNCMINFLSRL